MSCFNYGYAPAPDEVLADSAVSEPYQVEMYRQAAEAIGLDKLRGASVLEISCGLAKEGLVKILVMDGVWTMRPRRCTFKSQPGL